MPSRISALSADGSRWPRTRLGWERSSSWLVSGTGPVSTLRPRRRPGIRTGANGPRITPGCRHHHAQGADAGPALTAPASTRRIEIMDMKLEVAGSPGGDVDRAKDFYRVHA